MLQQVCVSKNVMLQCFVVWLLLHTAEWSCVKLKQCCVVVLVSNLGVLQLCVLILQLKLQTLTALSVVRHL